MDILDYEFKKNEIFFTFFPKSALNIFFFFAKGWRWGGGYHFFYSEFILAPLPLVTFIKFSSSSFRIDARGLKSIKLN